jgi:hypothetical protein
VNTVEAKRILVAYRQGSTDTNDPEVAAALAQARRDPELQQWLQSQSAFHQTMQETFQHIPVPNDLRDRILARPKIIKSLPRAWRQVLQAAAVLVLSLGLLGLVVWWYSGDSGNTFDTFRARMVRTVLRQYAMNIQTNDMAQIRQFLATNSAPSDYVLPQGLSKLPPTGAGLLRWQGDPVSMVCVDSGDQGTLFLFVVDRLKIKRLPGSSPEFAKVSRLMTVSWTQDGKTYVLAGAGGKETLKKHL